VYYKNLPKKFIAGTVYTPADKEVAIGATCTLTGQGGPYTATTDAFGDFWFDGLPDADFTLKIEKDGKTVTMPVSTKKEDQGLGDIALS
jgi:tetrathionate reductase subunit B